MTKTNDHAEPTKVERYKKYIKKYFDYARIRS